MGKSVYARIVASRIRSQLAYPVSFALDVFSQLLGQSMELLAILVIFTQVTSLGGFSAGEVVLIYGLAATAFGLADLAVGQVEALPDYIRTGEFDVILLRPLGALAQLLSADVQLRRVGRVAVGLVTLAWALRDVEWTPLRVVVAVVAPLAGAVLLSAIWIAANCVSFWLVDGREVANSVTYGSDFATSYPITVYGPWLRRIMCFVVPGAFVAYFPALALTGRPDPLGFPDFVRYCSPLVAAAMVGVAALRLAHRGAPLPGDGVVIVETEGLTRTFVVARRKRVTAVEGVTLTIAAGEAVGFLGPNGAGKSTTIKMLTGVLVPTAGRATGVRARPGARAARAGPAHRRRVRAAQPALVGPAAARELRPARRHPPGALPDRLDECVELLDMAEFLATPVRQLSLGQRMRGEVTAALLHRPELLVLDEPTIGLDLASKERLRAFLADLVARGAVTLLLTTHDLPDVERLCRRVVVIDRGRVLVDDDLAALRARFGGAREVVVDLAEPAPPLTGLPGVHDVTVEAGGLRQRLAFAPADTTAAAVIAAVAERAALRDVAVVEPSIESLVRTLYAG